MSSYVAGNSEGTSETGQRCIGCGLQETFINCADISIGGTGQAATPRRTLPPAVVVPDTPEFTQMIDNASPDAFSEVLNAIRGIHDTVSQISGTNSNTGGAGQNPVVPQVQFNSRGAGDFQGLTNDMVPQMNQPNVGPSWTAQEAAWPRLDVALPPPSSINTVRDFNFQRRFEPSVQALPNVVTRIVPTVVNTGFQHSPNIHIPAGIQETIASAPSVPSFQPHHPPNVQVSQPGASVGQFPNPLEEHQGPSSLLGSVSNTVGALPKRLIPGLQVGGSIFGPQSGTQQAVQHQQWSTNTNIYPQSPNSMLSNVNQQRQQMTNMAVNAPPSSFITHMNTLRNEFSNPTAWHRGDGMTSEREAVRPAPMWDTHDFSVAEIRQQVPQLPHDIGPRQDLPTFVDGRNLAFMPGTHQNNLMGDQQARLNEVRLRMHEERMRMQNTPTSGTSTIPRRLEVQSMAQAQHLLRKFPQLRGRVYLSRAAHLRNTLSNMSQHLARRQGFATM